MKILILSSYFSSNVPTDRIDFIASSLSHYLSIKPDVEILTDIPPTYGKTVLTTKIKQYPKVDHVILIDKYGFKYRHPSFINRLRKTTRGCISSFMYTCKHLGSEDINFHLLPGNRINCFHVKMACDHNIINKKNKKSLNIVFNDEPTKQIIEFYENNHKHLKINLYQINKYNYCKYGKNKKHSLNNYLDKIKFISKIDIFIILNKKIDMLLLFELGMIDAVIVGPKKLCQNRHLQLLNIVPINNDIDWITITDRLNEKKNRDRLINNKYTIEEVSNTVYDILNNFKRDEQKEVEDILKKNEQKEEYNKIINVKKKIVTRNAKILLQSNI